MTRSLIKAACLATSALLLPALAAAQDEMEGSTEEATSEETSTEAVGTEEVSPDADTSDLGGISLGALLGYGVSFDDGDLNPFGLMLGGRAGYTLDMGVYVGGTTVFHVGETEEFPGGEFTARMLQLGIEGGYDLKLGPVVVRPYLGLGLNFGFASSTRDAIPVAGMPAVDTSDTNTDFYLNIGGTVLYPIGKFFVGGDLRFSNVFADNETLNGMVFGVTGGMKL